MLGRNWCKCKQCQMIIHEHATAPSMTVRASTIQSSCDDAIADTDRAKAIEVDAVYAQVAVVTVTIRELGVLTATLFNGSPILLLLLQLQ